MRGNKIVNLALFVRNFGWGNDDYDRDVDFITV